MEDEAVLARRGYQIGNANMLIAVYEVPCTNQIPTHFKERIKP